ncbi:hypothetical protein JJB09_22300, partial [Rhizobium sp. KVB221]
MANPTGTDFEKTINEDGAYTFTSSDFGWSDADSWFGDTFGGVKITTLPASGTLTLNGTAVESGDKIAASDIPNLVWTPVANANGDVSFDFQVYSKWFGFDGGTDQSPNTATLHVAAANDAPVLTLSSPHLTSINEDAVDNAGQTIASVLGDSVADVDTGAVEGIAITGLTSGNGTWQYQLAGSADWVNVGSVSGTGALLLGAADSIRFVPNGENGTDASFTYHAWDQTSGVHGTLADTTTNGTTSAFSSGSDTATIAVSEVNDPAKIEVLEGSDTSVTEDSDVTAGNLVATGSISVDDVDGADTAT